MGQSSRNTLILSNLILPVLILIILTFCGFVLFRLLRKDEKSNKLLTLGASMILGHLGFLFLLSTLSYFFKGMWAILGIFSLYFFSCVFLYLKKLHPLDFKKIIPKLTLTNTIFSLVLIIYLGVLFVFTHRTYVGSDAEIYWAIATSFAKGNYPTVQSWQHQFLTVYHQGTFMVEGAINLISKSRIELIHFLFSFYLLAAIFIFLLGLVKKSLLSFLPSIIAVFLIGPVILLAFPHSLQNFSQYPDFSIFQGSNGAGAVDLQGLIYINFYTFGLASFLVFMYFLKNNLISLILLALLASIDETFFLVGVPLVILNLIQDLYRSRVKHGMTILGSALFLIILLVILPNPIRDSFFTPSEIPRFKLLLEMDNPPPYFYQKGESLNWNGVAMGQTASSLVASRLSYAGFRTLETNNTTWAVLDLKILILLLYLSLFLTIWDRDRYNETVFLLTSASLFSFILSLFIINTFWPSNALRITNQP